MFIRQQEKEFIDAEIFLNRDKVIKGIKCEKCGGDNVTYRQAQTRSADEPETVFFRCLACSNRWKE
jgi:DNA-directed RNA polymerase subunit M/transcription elongation factor TFIIS